MTKLLLLFLSIEYKHEPTGSYTVEREVEKYGEDRLQSHICAFPFKRENLSCNVEDNFPPIFNFQYFLAIVVPSVEDFPSLLSTIKRFETQQDRIFLPCC